MYEISEANSPRRGLPQLNGLAVIFSQRTANNGSFIMLLQLLVLSLVASPAMTQQAELAGAVVALGRVNITAPPAEIEACVDLEANCKQRSDEGDCESEPAFMLVNCAISCNSCLPSNVSECVDKHETDSCYLGALLGECEANPSFYLRFCADSCREFLPVCSLQTRIMEDVCDGESKSLANPDFKCGLDFQVNPKEGVQRSFFTFMGFYDEPNAESRIPIDPSSSLGKDQQEKEADYVNSNENPPDWMVAIGKEADMKVGSKENPQGRMTISSKDPDEKVTSEEEADVSEREVDGRMARRIKQDPGIKIKKTLEERLKAMLIRRNRNRRKWKRGRYNERQLKRRRMLNKKSNLKNEELNFPSQNLRQINLPPEFETSTLPTTTITDILSTSYTTIYLIGATETTSFGPPKTEILSSTTTTNTTQVVETRTFCKEIVYTDEQPDATDDLVIYLRNGILTASTVIPGLRKKGSYRKGKDWHIPYFETDHDYLEEESQHIEESWLSSSQLLINSNDINPTPVFDFPDWSLMSTDLVNKAFRNLRNIPLEVREPEQVLSLSSLYANVILRTLVHDYSDETPLHNVRLKHSRRNRYPLEGTKQNTDGPKNVTEVCYLAKPYCNITRHEEGVCDILPNENGPCIIPCNSDCSNSTIKRNDCSINMEPETEKCLNTTMELRRCPFDMTIGISRCEKDSIKECPLIIKVSPDSNDNNGDVPTIDLSNCQSTDPLTCPVIDIGTDDSMSRKLLFSHGSCFNVKHEGKDCQLDDIGRIDCLDVTVGDADCTFLPASNEGNECSKLVTRRNSNITLITVECFGITTIPPTTTSAPSIIDEFFENGGAETMAAAAAAAAAAAVGIAGAVAPQIAMQAAQAGQNAQANQNANQNNNNQNDNQGNNQNNQNDNQNNQNDNQNNQNDNQNNQNDNQNNQNDNQNNQNDNQNNQNDNQNNNQNNQDNQNNQNSNLNNQNNNLGSSQNANLNPSGLNNPLGTLGNNLLGTLGNNLLGTLGVAGTILPISATLIPKCKGEETVSLFETLQGFVGSNSGKPLDPKVFSIVETLNFCQYGGSAAVPSMAQEFLLPDSIDLAPPLNWQGLSSPLAANFRTKRNIDEAELHIKTTRAGTINPPEMLYGGWKPVVKLHAKPYGHHNNTNYKLDGHTGIRYTLGNNIVSDNESNSYRYHPVTLSQQNSSSGNISDESMEDIPNSSLDPTEEEMPDLLSDPDFSDDDVNESKQNESDTNDELKQKLGRKAFFCGGTLITSRHILTAAHCVTKRPNVIRLGEVDFRSSNESRVVDFGVKRIAIFPGYKYPTKYNDIAVITLERDVPLESGIVPGCVPTTELDLQNGDNGFVSGWGTRPNAVASEVLVNVDVVVRSLVACNDSYKELGPLFTFSYPEGLTPTMFCASGEEGNDVCRGDSGGPMFLKENAFIAGVVSSGHGCGDSRFPGIYTKVDSYLTWMDLAVYGRCASPER